MDELAEREKGTRQLQDAIRVTNRQLRQIPVIVRLGVIWVVAYAKKGEYDNAISCYKQAVEIKVDYRNTLVQ
jgi:lipopolysaccharide biosynthesis regulator YciM